MATPTGCPSAAHLEQFLLGHLTEGERARLEGHILQCAHCLHSLEAVKGTDTLVEAMRRGAASEATASRAAGHDAGGPNLYAFLAPAERPDEIGRLGTYRILKVLGAGGMGVVFQAEDAALKRNVALKAMLPSLAADKSARQRFVREAQAAAAVEHDHIVPIYQVGEDHGVPFLAMPLLKGESLHDRLQREPVLPVAEVVRIGREAAEGLAAAHAHGLVHRDIKPANLWLEGDAGRVKILDFGLAKAATDAAHLTQLGAVVGTPAYMAPEQGGGQAPDPRSDLFSLGCVLYQACTGRRPFQGADVLATLAALAMHQPPAPHAVRPEVPRALSDLVMHLLAKKPADRPASAQAVAELLERIACEPAGPRRRRVHAGKPDTRSIGWTVAGVAACAVLIGLAGLGAVGVFRFKTKDHIAAGELHKSPNGLPRQPDGFVPLFNGKDLTGWSVEHGNAAQWAVEESAIVGRSDGPRQFTFLLFDREYADFILRVEFMLEDDSSGGIAVRAFDGERVPSEKGNLILSHPLIRLSTFPNEALGTTHWVKKDDTDRKTNRQPAETLPLPAGVWHALELTVQGNACVALVGGKQFLDIRSDPRRGRMFTPALQRTSGKIGLQARLGTIYFRQVQIKELPQGTPATE
jgi:serine/threonine protein kinase